MSSTANYNLPTLSNESGLSAYLAQIKKFPMLDAEEEYMLAKNWKTTGNLKSAEKLVTSHLRLVAKIAMGYKGYGMPVNEMISEGNVGLMKAVKKFEPEKGFRLATYAMWWIKASIQEYILRSWSLVKIGTTTAQKKLFFNLKKLKNQIAPKSEGDLRDEHVKDIADKLNVSEEEVVSMNRRLSGKEQSLNTPIGEDGDEWQDWVVDKEMDHELKFAQNEEMEKRKDLLQDSIKILNDRENVSVVAINDIADNDAMVYLLKYDTVMGRFNDSVKLDGDVMKTSRNSVKMIAERDPSQLPWDRLGVDVVIEATGIFRTRQQIQQHIDAGASRVILTVPAKDEIDYTLVIGVNDDELTADHKIISNASCTTNCLAPMAKILNDNFGIEYGVINTIHAYTNDQRLADVPHSDWRRSRAAAENIIPTTTGAAKAVGKVLPELKGKLDGIAMRVPVPDGSVVDSVFRLNKDVTVDEINETVLNASKTDSMNRVVEYSTLPVVSTDIIGNPHSSIFDAPFTKVIEGSLIKTLNWYDNEWGYSNRVVDLVDILSQFN